MTTPTTAAFPFAPSAQEAARFVAKVRVTGSCWQWSAYVTGTGYGLFSIRKRLVQAHRAAYTWAKGEIPVGKVIDHLCRNTRCVNPEHLEAVTQRENVHRSDGVTARNARRTHCPKGHPYDDANTYRPPSGGRYCRACTSQRSREWKRAKTRGTPA